jgi:hypothetical protein
VKYVCLCYEEEEQLKAMPKSEWDAIVREVHAYNEELIRPLNYRRRTPIRSDGHDGESAERQGVHYRWSLYRDQGTVGWILPDRSEGPADAASNTSAATSATST